MKQLIKISYDEKKGPLMPDAFINKLDKHLEELIDIYGNAAVASILDQLVVSMYKLKQMQIKKEKE